MGAVFVPAATSRFPGSNRALYPSFDDGPGCATERLLDDLERLGVRTTFFFSGAMVRDQVDLVRRAAEDGHTIGSHGFDHVDAWKVGGKYAVADLQKGHQALQDALGRSITWVRPPHGHVRRATLRWMSENSARLAVWDVDPGDYLPGGKAHDITRKIIREARSGSVVVLHENASTWDSDHPAGACLAGLMEAGFDLHPFPEEWISTRSERAMPGSIP